MSAGEGRPVTRPVSAVDINARLAAFAPGNTAYAVGCLFTSTADAAVANTVAETSVIGTGVGSLTLAAASLIAGKTIRITCRGKFSDTGTPTLNLKVKAGATVLAATGAIALAGTIADREWSVTCDVTCRSVGATGTVVAVGRFVYDESTHLGTCWGMVNAGTVTVDTTGTLALDVTATWGTASASNTITGQTCIVEVLS